MKKTLLLLLIIFVKLSSADSQVLDSMMKVYAEEFPEQKVHVHFDKEIYRAGESIWFKAYILAGFRLTSNSKNFYTELIDKQGNIVQRKVYPIVESTASGNFDLAENTPAGSYICRAYTSWMLNFDTAFLYTKQLTVVDKNGAPARGSGVAASPSTHAIQFFAEGGNLVNDIECTVAFKANDNFGTPVFVKGNIVNSKGTVVTSFSAQHDGMGIFKLTPQAGETYKATWTDSLNRQQTTDLPATKSEGVVLHMAPGGAKKIYTLSRSPEASDDLKTVYVVAQLGQEKIYKARVSLQNSFFTSGVINTADLPSGILTVTVFSATMQPLAERIVMVNNDNYMFDTKLNSTEINTNIRAKNSIEVEVADTMLSNLSIAVTDAEVNQPKYADNIISRLLVTGDIKGYVHNPGYYFSNKTDSVKTHLDLVLLTHGWRSYNWSNLVAGRKRTVKYPADANLSLTAKVFGVTNLSPLRSDEQIVAVVQAADSSSQIITIPRTGKDEFATSNAIFFDTIRVFYNFSKDRALKERASVLFSNNFYKGPKIINLSERPWLLQNTDTGLANRTRFLADQINKFGSKFDGKGNVLQNVTVTGKVKSRLQQLEEKYASGMFRGSDGYAFDFTDPTNFATDIFTFLQGRVAGLQINNSGGTPTASWRGSETVFFVDEMQSDADRVRSLSVADIAYVKVLRPPFMGAMGGGGGGAIAIYTKRGNDVQVTPGKGLSSSVVTGYSSAKQFYSPNYASRLESSEVVADYRSTLYWNPTILTGQGRQKVKVEFYNNDVSKSFRVVLEGVNEIGQIVRIEKIVK